VTAVVSDNSPLSYLIQIKCDHCLPALYERILIPEAVLRELHDPRTPEVVRAWLSRPPAWLVVREVRVAPDLEFDELDAGERNAIQLAIDACSWWTWPGSNRRPPECHFSSGRVTESYGVLLEGLFLLGQMQYGENQ
jgi:hypothetical protein